MRILVNIDRLPKPPRPATREVRIGEIVSDWELYMLTSADSWVPKVSGDFSPEEDRTILRMAESGETNRSIARALGRNIAAVATHRRILLEGKRRR